MNRFVITLFALALFFPAVNSQNNFKPGYVISLYGDTIYGEIDYKADTPLSERCDFRTADGERKVFLPSDIHAYQFTGGRMFVSKHTDNGDWFLELLVKGHLRLYYRYKDLGNFYYVEKDDFPLKRIPYSEGMMKEGITEYRHQSTLHIGFLTSLMHDTPQLHDQIKKIKEPKHSNLMKLVYEYNLLVKGDSEAVMLQSLRPPRKKRLEGTLGTIIWPNDNTTYAFFFGGAQFSIQAKASDEKIFFKTGLLYSQLRNDKSTAQCVLIPIGIEYEFPGKKIRPALAAGIHGILFFEDGDTGFIYYDVFSAGLNYHLSDRFALSVKYGISTRPIIATLAQSADGENTERWFLWHNPSIGFIYKF